MDTFDTNAQGQQVENAGKTNTGFKLTGYDHWQNPPRKGKPANGNYEGASTGECGDTIRIFLYIQDDKVLDAGYDTDGCRSSNISGSMAAELAVGKLCDELTDIDGETVLKSLGSMPTDEYHCAWLAANALHEAVGDYYKKTTRQPK
ncbi:MAG: iron-sulfur cluster assembly scaffold protein [Desulfovibrio sp.]|uniref:iron-sulfur cluster assembly scaffold protein n=1 Tax=Desulfovibrio sp. 7SRBS1 TaxID=3378064 RepID=UPI003B3F574D